MVVELDHIRCQISDVLEEHKIAAAVVVAYTVAVVFVVAAASVLDWSHCQAD